MINTNKLKAKIVENGLTVDDVATKLGINRVTFYRKLNKKDFTTTEACRIKELLHLTTDEAVAIFFAD